MFSAITLVLALLITVKRYLKNKVIFKQLSKKEWVQYIGSFVFAWAVAVFIVIGGKTLMDNIEITWIRVGLTIVCVLVGLYIASVILNKTMPIKLRNYFFTK